MSGLLRHRPPGPHPLSGDPQNPHRLGGRGEWRQRRSGGPHLHGDCPAVQKAGAGQLPGGVQHRGAGGAERAPPPLPRPGRPGHDLASGLIGPCSSRIRTIFSPLSRSGASPRRRSGSTCPSPI